MGIVRHKETVHPATGCYPSHGSGDQSSCIKSSASAISTKSPNHSMLNVGRDFWWPRSDSLSKQTEKVVFYTCWQSLQGLLSWCLQKEITTQPTSYHHNHWCTSIFWIETPTDNFHLQIQKHFPLQYKLALELKASSIHQLPPWKIQHGAEHKKSENWKTFVKNQLRVAALPLRHLFIYLF